MNESIYFRAGDIMTPEPVTVEAQSTLADVEAIFEKNDFNGLPIVDEDCKLIGMVTKLDLLKAFVFTKTSKIPPYAVIMKKPVSQVMTKAPAVAHRDTGLSKLLHHMIETGHKSMPVVEDDRVVGIVAREDIIRALRTAAQGIRAAPPGSSG